MSCFRRQPRIPISGDMLICCVTRPESCNYRLLSQETLLFFLLRAPFLTLFLFPTFFLLCQCLSPLSAHANISNQLPSLMTCLLVTTLVLLPRFVQITFCCHYTTSMIPLRVEQFASLIHSISTTSKIAFANRILLDIIRN